MQKIAIHSVPRSGSTWLGNIFNSHPHVCFKLQPLFSYAFKNYLHENSTSEEIQSFFGEIASSEDSFINQVEGIKKGIVPKFIKEAECSHVCYKEVRYHHILPNLMEKNRELRLILLVRNPLAVIYSWQNAPKEFRKDQGWDFENEWQFAASKNLNRREEYNGYEKWKEATRLFLELEKKYPQRTLLVTYANLISETEQTVKILFDFTNLEMAEETFNFLINSRKLNNSDAYSVYKNRKADDSWHRLPAHIKNHVLNDLKGTVLEKFL